MRRTGGFTYIGLLVMIAIIGITTSVVGMSLRAEERIEKEKELLWIGHQYRQAIRDYYVYHLQRFQQASAHAQVNISGQVIPQFYPTSIDDLLKDPIAPGTLRHLRKKYIDPMTGKDDWVLIPVGSAGQSGEGQGVSGQSFWGVRSNSDKETMKRDNFLLEDFRFKGKTKYSEWEFTYNPQEDPSVVGAAAVQTQPALQTPAATPTPTPTEQPPPGQ